MHRPPLPASRSKHVCIIARHQPHAKPNRAKATIWGLSRRFLLQMLAHGAKHGPLHSKTRSRCRRNHEETLRTTCCCLSYQEPRCRLCLSKISASCQQGISFRFAGTRSLYTSRARPPADASPCRRLKGSTTRSCSCGSRVAWPVAPWSSLLFVYKCCLIVPWQQKWSELVVVRLFPNDPAWGCWQHRMSFSLHHACQSFLINRRSLSRAVLK